MTQKELKEKYMNVICKEVWVDDEGMQKYAKNECNYVVELASGDIISIDKPRIEKDFCFGMGMYGTYTDDECKRAENAAENARKNQQYFIDQNMRDLNSDIKVLNECLDRMNGKECYVYIKYSGTSDDCILKEWKTVRLGENPDYMPFKWYGLRDVKKLDAADIQRIIDGLEEVKKSFAKRLNTYLKKYGLSKVNAWTYCVD